MPDHPKKRPSVLTSVIDDDPLKDYDPQYLECRATSHRWDVVGFFHDHYGQIVRQLLCSRCETTRRDVWTRHGERVEAHYDYADGYQIKGHGHVDRSDVRMATLRKVRVYNSEAEMLANVLGTRRAI